LPSLFSDKAIKYKKNKFQQNIHIEDRRISASGGIRRRIVSIGGKEQAAKIITINKNMIGLDFLNPICFIHNSEKNIGA